jgi:hypothetical protein
MIKVGLEIAKAVSLVEELLRMAISMYNIADGSAYEHTRLSIPHLWC